MKLTTFCDYSLRVLMYLGIKNEKSSIGEIARAYGISKNHAVKVVHNLAKLGYIQSIQGKNGGIKLARSPKDINLGRVVEQVEPDFNLVECFLEKQNNCRISPACRLKNLLKLAQKEFLNTLRNHNLSDIIENRSSLLASVGRHLKG